MIFTIFWAIIGFIFFFGYPYIAKTFSYKQSEVTWNAPKERINYLWCHMLGVEITMSFIAAITDNIGNLIGEISLPITHLPDILVYILQRLFNIAISFTVYAGIVSLYTHENWKISIRKVCLGYGLTCILVIPFFFSDIIYHSIETQLILQTNNPMEFWEFSMFEAYANIYIIPFLLIFWIRKKTLDSFFHKISGGEFNAPSNRFNKLLLPGICCFVITTLASFGALKGFHAIAPDPTLQTRCLIYSSAFIAGNGILLIFWLIMCKFPHKTSPALAASRLLYAYLETASWILFIIAAYVAVIAVLVVVVVGFFIWLILTFATAQEFTVKTGGLFGTTKKIWGNRNLDGTVTGLDGEKYKKDTI